MNKEILGIVVIKVAMLSAIWTIFFSHPTQAQLDDSKMVKHLIVNAT